MSRFAGLRPMKVAGATPATPAVASSSAEPRSSLAALIPPRPTDAGPLHLKEIPAGQWLPVDPRSVSALTLEPPVDCSRPIFVDTETTGLAGGTGTIPFLIGIAHVVDGQVVVEQGHVAGPGQERPVLEWLRTRLTPATVLLTFNGKSFDWPLIRARFVMNRLRPPPELPHVDLLHASRRVFKYELEQATLGTLERHALGLKRVGDLGGALIPAVWFDFLRSGRVAMLARVLEHNERDVRSMVDLLQVLVGCWEGQVAMPPARRFALALLAHRHGDDQRAFDWAHALDGERGAVGSLALELKAALLRRRGDPVGAVAALERALETSPAAARVRLKLAKLYEHHLKDPATALTHAPLAREAERPDVHARRLGRLRRRV